MINSPTPGYGSNGGPRLLRICNALKFAPPSPHAACRHHCAPTANPSTLIGSPAASFPTERSASRSTNTPPLRGQSHELAALLRPSRMQHFHSAETPRLAPDFILCRQIEWLLMDVETGTRGFVLWAACVIGRCCKPPNRLVTGPRRGTPGHADLVVVAADLPASAAGEGRELMRRITPPHLLEQRRRKLR